MSKTVTVRLPDGLWERVEARRRLEGRSFSGMQVRLLELALVALGEGEPSLAFGAQASDARSASPSPSVTVGGAPVVADALARTVRQVASSGCPMVVPRGTKCKACGKVHG